MIREFTMSGALPPADDDPFADVLRSGDGSTP
jgi:hypothetical protein